MVRRVLPLLALAIVGAGCGSSEPAVPETKPNDVAPQLTAEQQAQVEARKGQPLPGARDK
ncbi:MAG: hypothetical protein ACO1SV_27825 [Fimbriimonas sp.]